jgi:hypothetical protein
MPQRPGHYALIHNDISAGNFFYAPGEVQLFDFDQSCYGWSLQHLVNPIYPHYIFPAVSIPGARTADLALFFRPLVTGCRAEQSLSIEQLRLANALLQLKESFGYLILNVVRGINCAGGPFSTLGCCALESVSIPKAPFCNLGYDPRSSGRPSRPSSSDRRLEGTGVLCPTCASFMSTSRGKSGPPPGLVRACNGGCSR